MLRQRIAMVSLPDRVCQIALAPDAQSFLREGNPAQNDRKASNAWIDMRYDRQTSHSLTECKQ